LLAIISWIELPQFRPDLIPTGPADEMTTPALRGGDVYTHWGKAMCNNESTTIYSG